MPCRTGTAYSCRRNMRSGSSMTGCERSSTAHKAGARMPGRAMRAVLAILTAAWLCGCGGPATPATGHSPHTAAPEEPVLHVYNWDGYIGSDTVARFERATG